MYLKSSISPPPFLLLSFFLLFSSATTAFNITQLLAQYSDFSTFNGYLTDTQLAADINKRQTITILAVDNGALSPLSGKPKNVIKKVASLHVLLDYFDVPKLHKLPNNTAILPTLFQTSGESNGQQGFLNVTHLSTGGVAFGSASQGATLGADLVKSIASQPYNLSVLQISSVIIPSGIDNSSTSHSPSPTPPPPPPPPLASSAPAPEPTRSNKSLTPAPEPTRSNKSLTPAPTPAKTPSPPRSSKAPPPSPRRPIPSRPPLGPAPAKAPATHGGPVADGPTPFSSPRGSPPADDDDSSAPATVGIHLAVVIMLVTSLWSLT